MRARDDDDDDDDADDNADDNVTCSCRRLFLSSALCRRSRERERATSAGHYANVRFGYWSAVRCCATRAHTRTHDGDELAAAASRRRHTVYIILVLVLVVLIRFLGVDAARE